MPVIAIQKPKVVKKQVTVRQVYEAFEKNGLDHLRGEFFQEQYDEDIDGGTLTTTIGACLLGQGAYNLNTSADGNSIPTELIEGLSTAQYRKYREYSREFALYKQLNAFMIPAGDRSGVRGLAAALIEWNDAQKDNGDYVLPTYQDVLDKAKELMEPFFNKKVTLLVVK